MFIKVHSRHSDGDVSGDAQSSLENNFSKEEKSNLDPQRLFNENQKNKRLYEKSLKEIENLRGELGSVKPILDQFRQAFGGQKPTEGDAPMSYLDKVRATHNKIKEEDPNSNGLALTLEGAELIEQLRQENAALKKASSQNEQPEGVASKQMFVRLEHEIKEKLYEMFTTEELADDNYPDYERVAIKKLQAIRENKREWMKLLNNPEKVKELANTIFSEKMPRMDKMPGWQKINDYSPSDAQADEARAEKMTQEAYEKGDRKLLAEASKLQTKARQRLLPLRMGIEKFNNI